MSKVETQCVDLLKRNGSFGGATVSLPGGKKIPCPMMNTFDAIMVAAFWFDEMRDFFVHTSARPVPWQLARINRVTREVEGAGDNPVLIAAIHGQLGSWSIADYLASPRKDAASLNSDDRLRAVTIPLGGGYLTSDPYLVYTLTSSDQSWQDTSGSFTQYVRNIMGYWDTLVMFIKRAPNWALPSTLPGAKWATLNDAKSIIELCARVEEFMAARGNVYASQRAWDDYLTQSAEAVKAAAEVAVKQGAQWAGDAAGWAADQAGKAYGNFWASFLSNVGLWGVAFVAGYVIVNKYA